ncbi:ATP-dependent DNA ligase [Streptomyces sennicomposti]
MPHEVGRHGPIQPTLVAELDANVSLDAAGRWRHSVRVLHVRTDLAPGDVPLFGSGNRAAAG